MTKSRKCSLVTPKLSTSIPHFQIAVCHGFDLKRFAHFSKQQSSTRPIWCLQRYFWAQTLYQEPLALHYLQIAIDFGTLSFNFFLSGFHLGTSLSVELLSLDLVHSPMPKQNCSWRFLEHFWIFDKREGEIKSTTHYSRRATQLYLFKVALLNRAASYTCSNLR